MNIEIVSIIISLFVCLFGMRTVLKMIIPSKSTSKFVVAFFHPYCNAGGGGERVLWCGIKAIQDINPDISCVIYTGDNITIHEQLKKVKDTFGLEFNRPDNIELIHLRKRDQVEASRYKHFTMIGQSLGSMVLGWEALNLVNPHVFIDTMGYAFTYPIFRFISGCSVACYVHYPTISSDMLSRVFEQRASYNNDQRVNSTWTGNHISKIWRVRPHVAFPPCDTTSLRTIPLNWENREPIILSIAQFRPEKDHMLQLELFSLLLKTHPEHKGKVKLVLVGSCRGAEDQNRIDELKARSIKLDIQESVQFEVGISYAALRQWLSRATVGLHTMWCEHFGIGVVELMAAGVIPVAHNSGGPKTDIVKQGVTGFLAATAEEYSEHVHEILSQRQKFSSMQKEGREDVKRFSQENFLNEFKYCIRDIITI